MNLLPHQFDYISIALGAVLTAMLVLVGYRWYPHCLERAMARKKENQVAADVVLKALEDAVEEGKLSTAAKYRLTHRLGAVLPDLLPKKTINFMMLKNLSFKRLYASGLKPGEVFEKLTQLRRKPEKKSKLVRKTS